MNIRQGTIQDIPQLLEMIKELALFEKAPQEVKVTEHELANDLLNKQYSFIVAEINDTLVGIALYYIRYSTWKGKVIYLEDIIVKEQYRNKKIGNTLFTTMIELTKSYGARRMAWQVLDWNKNAIRFYDKFNAQYDSEWINGFINFE